MKYFFAISNIDGKNKKEILNICQETKAKVKILPGVQDLIKRQRVSGQFKRCWNRRLAR